MVGPDLAPGRVVERYVVEVELGRGGHAVVYRVRHTQLGTAHALKVLTVPTSHAAPRLLLEGRVQAGLRHPNIVSVTDVLDVDGTPGLLMEYVPPPSLADWLAGHRPSPAEVELLFRGIVAGVRHAHEHGLVHRDLKPSNVLLSPGDVTLVPKIADFGLAKILDADEAPGHTRSGSAMGTPLYMAPEQFRDAKAVDRRADLYSLGCVLHQMLSGAPPFPWTDVITLHATMVARGWQPLPAGVPDRLRAAVEGCLEPDPEVRVGDCTALLRLLDGAASAPGPTLAPLGRGRDAPVVARPSRPDPETWTSTLEAPRRAPAGGPGPVARARWPGVVVASVAGVALAALAWSARGAREPALSAEAVTPPVEVAVTAPVPVATMPAPATDPAPEAVARTPSSRPRPAAAPPEARPVATDPVPAAVPPPSPAAPPVTATVTLDGDPARAWLLGDGGTVPLPGEVPPGDYVLWVDFGEGPVKGRRLSLAAGQVRALRCSAGMTACN